MNRFEENWFVGEREREIVGLDGFYFLACLASVTSIFLAIWLACYMGGLEFRLLGSLY